MGTATRDMLYAAEHFIARNARLLDRYRYAHHFQGDPPRAALAVLDTYRNIDGGYGNALEPELRGHGSQPLATARALRLLDELGALPADTVRGLCRYLTGVTRPDGGVPPVLPNVRYTEVAPWWRDRRDFTGSLNPTAAIAGLLHKHHITGPWRDRATAFCWGRIRTLRWTDAEEADAVCVFLHHAPDRARARAETTRLASVIRAVVDTDPAAQGRVHTPLDLARRPDDLACTLFTDAEIDAHLDALIATQDTDGGWPLTRTWAAGPDAERRGDLTVRHLLTLSAHGRVPRPTPPTVPPPRRRMNVR
ncbi:prenyltransferase [Thermobifida halotolerans]|uniref:Prenyltransferase n=1 Tax=Thermobifida halotolerans TaxID=483545 RepID=A0A399G4U0_9ACTN|nr:prenyltransferase [Thermobifida halotolerans]UOE20294.1 prenyltransferase [Thermobifida halotolerans]